MDRDIELLNTICSVLPIDLDTIVKRLNNAMKFLNFTNEQLNQKCDLYFMIIIFLAVVLFFVVLFGVLQSFLRVSDQHHQQQSITSDQKDNLKAPHQ